MVASAVLVKGVLFDNNGFVDEKLQKDKCGGRKLVRLRRAVAASAKKNKQRGFAYNTKLNSRLDENEKNDTKKLKHEKRKL